MADNDNIKKIDNYTYHFTCLECGREIMHLGPEPKEAKCAFCLWLNEFVPDPEEQVRLREIIMREQKNV